MIHEQDLIGDGRQVWAGGEWRYLTREKPAGATLGLCGASPYSHEAVPIIPRSEWSAICKRKDAEQSWPKDFMDFHPLDQDGTNYCWCNAVVNAARCTRRRMGLPYADLSPASVAAPIKGGANQGGWGGEALEYMIKNGVSTTDLWPANSRDTSKLTDAVKESYRHFQVKESYECKSFDEVASAVMAGYAVFVGYSWWSHEVLITRIYETGGAFSVEIANSWGDWGTKNKWGIFGFQELSVSKGTNFDDAGFI